MPILTFEDANAFGKVSAVDTATVRVTVDDIEQLRSLQVNRLVALRSSKPGQHLIGIVQRIVRTGPNRQSQLDELDDELTENLQEDNSVRVGLVGTLAERAGLQSGVFRRTLESVPEIDSCCFKLEGDQLSNFMRVVSKASKDNEDALTLGRYTLDEDAEAFVDGNRFFQRHAAIVGSTGSGKSWATARLLEQIAKLKSASALVFDLHGEYKPICGEGVEHLRLAGPGDLDKDLDQGIIFLPHWILTYENLITMLIDRSDQNAPNQAMLVARTVRELKLSYLTTSGNNDVVDNFTVDSPIPFSLADLLLKLNDLDSEMVAGSRSEKQGPFHGKLSRLIARLENRSKDRRLGFMFNPPEATSEFDWLEKLCVRLMKPGCIKIIDCSEVPSDVIPLVIGGLSRLVFSVQQWTRSAGRHPIALVCEEAHLYIPSRPSDEDTSSSVIGIFNRIAKEGRKYGVGLVVVSQRPSEVNRTVLSQCNNFIALRLTNVEDQGVVHRLLPDNLGGFAELLPILDTGEAVLVGDACLLPSRVRIAEPQMKPNSATVDFWDEWQKVGVQSPIKEAVHALRCQRHFD